MEFGFERLPKSKIGSVLLASVALFSSGCSPTIEIDSYLTDVNGVQCDGRRTMADFGDLSRVSFLAHEDGTDIVQVNVRRDKNGKYEYSAEPVGEKPKDPVEVIGNEVSNGSANPDFSFAHGDSVWSVDVRPDDPSAVISGNCP